MKFVIEEPIAILYEARYPYNNSNSNNNNKEKRRARQDVLLTAFRTASLINNTAVIMVENHQKHN